MGSAEGRRKCNEFFFQRGYRHAYHGRKGDEAPTGEMLTYRAGTVSRSLAGLYRIGFEWGVKDRKAGTPETRRYDEYRQQRDKE